MLHWLASMGPGVVCRHLQPTIMHASLCRLAEEHLLFSLPSPSSLPQPRHDNTLAAILDVIAQRVTRLSRQPPDTVKYVLHIIFHLFQTQKKVIFEMFLQKYSPPNYASGTFD